MFDWSKDGAHTQTDTRGIEVKRQLLLELVDFVGKNKAVFSEHVVVEIMKMVRVNLFRNLPPKVVYVPNLKMQKHIYIIYIYIYI